MTGLHRKIRSAINRGAPVTLHGQLVQSVQETDGYVAVRVNDRWIPISRLEDIRIDEHPENSGVNRWAP